MYSLNSSNPTVGVSQLLLEELLVVIESNQATLNDLSIILYLYLSDYHITITFNDTKMNLYSKIINHVTGQINVLIPILNEADQNTKRLFLKTFGKYDYMKDFDEFCASKNDNILKENDEETMDKLSHFFKDIRDQITSGENKNILQLKGIKILFRIIRTLSCTSFTKENKMYIAFIEEGNKMYWMGNYDNKKDFVGYLLYSMNSIRKPNGSSNSYFVFLRDFLKETEKRSLCRYHFLLRKNEVFDFKFLVNNYWSFTGASNLTVADLAANLSIEGKQNISFLDVSYLDKILDLSDISVSLYKLFKTDEKEQTHQFIRLSVKKKNQIPSLNIPEGIQGLDYYLALAWDYFSSIQNENEIVEINKVFPWVRNKSFHSYKNEIFEEKTELHKNSLFNNTEKCEEHYLFYLLIHFEINNNICLPSGRKTKVTEHPRYIIANYINFISSNFTRTQIRESYEFIPYDAIDTIITAPLTGSNKIIYYDLLESIITNYINKIYSPNSLKTFKAICNALHDDIRKITEDEIIIYGYPEKLFYYLCMMEIFKKSQKNIFKNSRKISTKESEGIFALSKETDTRIDNIKGFEKKFFKTNSDVFYDIKLLIILSSILLPQSKNPLTKEDGSFNTRYHHFQK